MSCAFDLEIGEEQVFSTYQVSVGDHNYQKTREGIVLSIKRACVKGGVFSFVVCNQLSFSSHVRWQCCPGGISIEY